MLRGLCWAYVLQYPAVERLRLDLSIIELGVTARDALGKIAGQCNIRQWLFEILPLEVELVFNRFEKLPPDGCLTCPPKDLLEIYILGAITSNLLELSYKLQDIPMNDEKGQAIVDEELDNRVKEGIEKGCSLLLHDLDKNLTYTRRSMRKLRQLDIFRKD